MQQTNQSLEEDPGAPAVLFESRTGCAETQPCNALGREKREGEERKFNSSDSSQPS